MTDHQDLIANAVDSSSRLAPANIVNVVVAMLFVVYVVVKRIGSKRDIRVELDVFRPLIDGMPPQICHICLKDRRTSGKGGRRLIRIPVEVTQHSAFQRKGIPARLCPHCDGDAYENVMEAHNKRIGGNDAENDA